jgi:ABC-2 type transport system permease protein
MIGMTSVFWKEMADHFGSKRFFFITLIIVSSSLFISYSATGSPALGQGDEQYLFLRLFTESAKGLPSFLFFISFFGPLMGIILGFDSISGEHSRGTLSFLLSQPIYRDSVINGKFLAGLATVATMIATIMVIMAGISIGKLGVIPNGQEVARAVIFFAASTLYIAFWMSLAILCSVVMKKSSTSALVAIAVWIFLTFFIYMFVGLVADKLVPVTQNVSEAELARHEGIKIMLMRLSPAVLLEEISLAVLNPSVSFTGPVLQTQVAGLIPSPLSIWQSLMVVWPQFVTLIAISLICFAIAYIVFMRQEIRA